VFKLSTTLGALNEGVVTLNQVIQAPGQLILTEKFSPNDPGRERPFVDWIFDKNPEGFGTIDFLRCIAYSSNVCLYKLGGGYKDEIPTGLGPNRLYESPVPSDTARFRGSNCPANRMGCSLPRSGSASTRVKTGPLAIPILPAWGRAMCWPRRFRCLCRARQLPTMAN
jgi:penicillin-binding protein 2